MDYFTCYQSWVDPVYGHIFANVKNFGVLQEFFVFNRFFSWNPDHGLLKVGCCNDISLKNECNFILAYWILTLMLLLQLLRFPCFCLNQLEQFRGCTVLLKLQNFVHFVSWANFDLWSFAGVMPTNPNGVVPDLNESQQISCFLYFLCLSSTSFSPSLSHFQSLLLLPSETSCLPPPHHFSNSFQTSD